VSVGVTSAAGYGVTVAAVVAAALDYIGGDHSQPTKTTLALGIVAGVSFVTTQVGRYLQAHAQIKAAPQLEAERRYSAEAERYGAGQNVCEPKPEQPSWLDEKTKMKTFDPVEEGYAEDSGVSGSWDHEQAGAVNVDNGWDPAPEGPGDDPPPQAALYPLTDPRSIPMDEGDGKAGPR
jgi:hypothetical protein